jgi:hypothetical protein
MSESHCSLLRGIAVRRVVVTRISADDGEALLQAGGHSGLEAAIGRAQIAVRTPSALEQKSSVPVRRQAQVELDRVSLAIGAGALAHDTNHFAVFRHCRQRTHPGRRSGVSLRFRTWIELRRQDARRGLAERSAGLFGQGGAHSRRIGDAWARGERSDEGPGNGADIPDLSLHVRVPFRISAVKP